MPKNFAIRSHKEQKTSLGGSQIQLIDELPACFIWCETNVWCRPPTAMVHTWIYDRLSPYPTPYCRGPLTQSKNVNHVHLEVDTVGYSWPEAMSAQAHTCRCMYCADAREANVNVMSGINMLIWSRYKRTSCKL